MFGLPFWWRWRRGGNKVASARKKAASKRATSLSFESLEDRITPSHGRYMNLYWEPVPTDLTGLTIKFHFQEGWRLSYFTGSFVGGPFNASSLSFGDSQSASLNGTVLSINTLEDWVFAESTVIHTYASAGNYTASTGSCCRISTLSNNADDSFEASTTVNAGSPIRNSAPVSSIAPIVQVSDNSVATIVIPALDPENYGLNFRLATSSETGSFSYVYPPGLVIDPNTGLITWDIRNTAQPTVNVGDLWTLQIVIEDFDDFGTIVSKTPVDFIIQVVDTVNNQPPIYDFPPTQASQSVVVGQTLTFTVQAGDANAGNIVNLFALNPPPGMTAAVVPAVGGLPNAYAVEYTWVPNAVGSVVVTFQAYDNLGLTALQAISINVTVPPPGVTVVQSGGDTILGEGGTVDTFTVFLNTQPDDPVIVTLTPNNQVTLSPTPTVLTFLPAAYNAPQTITVTAVNDSVFEGVHEGIITGVASSIDAVYDLFPLETVTAQINDDDFPGVRISHSSTTTDVAEGGQGGPVSDTYTAVLLTIPAANVLVTITPNSQVAAATSVLTFSPGNWNQPQQVVVTAVDDKVAEGLHPGVITHSTSSTDGNYNVIGVVPLTVNITDNDFAGVTILESGGTTKVTEGAGGDTYTVNLTSQPTANVVVTVSPDVAQLTGAPLALTFTSSNWNVKQSVSIAAINDIISESLHVGLVTHTAGSGDLMYNGIGVATVTASITDDDPIPAVLINETTPPTTTIEGTSRSFTVRLNSIPAADVVVNVNPDSQVTFSPSILTFSPATWNTPRPVAVTAIDDPTAQGNRAIVITTSVASTDPLYNGLASPSVTATILDNDGSVVTGTATSDNIVVAPAADLSQIIVTVNGKSTSLPGTISQLMINAGDGADNIYITNPLLSVVVNGQGGADKLFINGRASGNTMVTYVNSVNVNGANVSLLDMESLVLNGINGTNSFQLTCPPTYALEVKGGASADSLIGPDVDNTWKITGTNAGTVGTSVKFSSLENLTGGTGADTFLPSPGKGISGIFDGGGSGNTLDYSLFSTAVTIDLLNGITTGTARFRNVDTYKGGKSTADKLIGGIDNDWQVNSQNAGTINGQSFASIENLTGSAGYDLFMVNAGARLTGKIDGGGGTGDVLSYAAFGTNTAVLVNLQTKIATNTGGIANLESFVGSNGTSDKFYAGNSVNAWRITGSNTGKVNGLNFAGFENYTGGSLADVFTLESAASWFGTVDGAGGTDTIVGFPGNINVYIAKGLNAGSLNGLKFAGIEKRT